MPAVVYIAKEATPQQAGWRARIGRAEKPLVASFLAWVAALHAQIQETHIVQALLTGSTAAFDHVFEAVAFQPQLVPVAEAEAAREFEQTVRRVDATLRLSLNLRDPNFERAVRDHEARLVREVTRETRRGIANVVARAYRDGLHPYVVAPEIRETIGLTARQAQSVLSFAEAQTRRGVSPSVSADRAIRYARRLRTRRANTIARTETARAMVDARLASYEQAAAHGLFDVATAEIEWSAVQTDPAEICAQLDGQRVPLGDTFEGLLPPAHPNCRCSVHLVLDR